MKMKVTTGYAIKTILFLARKQEIVTTREISQAMQIPDNYEPKITRMLLKAGLIERFRGVKGGFRLKKEPKDIKLYDIIKIMDPDICKCAHIDDCEQLHDEIKFINNFYGDLHENVVFYLQSISIETISKNL